MNPILRFLNALRNLTQSGAIKSIDEAMDFAKREFGEVNDLLKRQIEQVFKRPQSKTPKPGEGGITSIKNAPKKKETPPQESGTIMDRISKASNRIEELMKEREAMYKPKQGLNLAEGLTRTIARKILDRKNIEIPPGRDPIGVFSDVFGESISDVNNLAEELIEIDQRGGGLKNIDKMIEMEGLFDIEIPKNPQRGLTDEEMLKLKKEVDQEKQLKDFDPTDREPNAMGGINRTNFALGGMKAIMAIINKIKKLDPMDAMKEVNEVVAKRGKYKNLDDDEVKKIFDETNDHIFERDVPADEFAVRFDEEVDIPEGVDPKDTILPMDKKILNDVDEAYGMAPKMVERFQLKERFPGIDDRLLTQIIDDPDPQRKAEAIATIDQAFELMRQGKSQEEVYDIMKQMTDRTKQAKGGLSYLMGM